MFWIQSSISSAGAGTDRQGFRWSRLLRWLGVFAVLAWLIYRRVDLREIWISFGSLRYSSLLLIVLILSPLAALLRALRWRLLAFEERSSSLISYVGAYLVGVLANLVLFGKAGDLVKAGLVSGRGRPYGRSVTVVLVDRLLEGLALLSLLLFGLLFFRLPPWSARLAWLGTVAGLGGLVFVRVVAHRRKHSLAWVDRALGRLSVSFRPIAAAMQQIESGCRCLVSARRMGGALAYSLAIWLVEIAAVGVFLQDLRIPAPLLASALVLVVVLNFGSLLPLTPGSIGVYQLLCVFGLSFWGVRHDQAFALGVVMQTVLLVPPCIGGLAWLMYDRMKPRRLCSTISTE